MISILFFLLMGANAHEIVESSDEVPAQEKSQDDSVDECASAAERLKKNLMGLEFFLQDKSDYKSYCPHKDWDQPTLQIYKKEPKSHLPKNCKTEKI